ncbi:MAG: helix-turn-helix domain-containing protein [Clostridiales bacterium]|nr:helix-turn-helix domain-containing protein [Clostridiales bacterium]
MPFIEVEQNIEKVGWSMPDLHSHPHYELYFLESGERSFYLGGSLYLVKENSAVLVPPYVMHKTEGGPFSRINVDFSDDFLTLQEKEVLQELGKTGVFPLGKEKGDSIRKVLISMLGSSKNQSKLDKVALSMCVKSLIGLLYFFRSSTEEVETVPGNGSISPQTLKIIRFINNNCRSKLTIASLAKEFSLSESCLGKSFKRETGYNVGEFILNARINEAKQLLSSAKLTVNEISGELGFSSANYFGLIFKQKVGVSPMMYKKWLKT